MGHVIKLLLLLVCCHLLAATSSSECEAFVLWHEGSILDLEDSGNATITVIQVFHVETKDECSKKCCQTDECTVATFDDGANLTCQHYSCTPVDACRLTTTSSQSLTFLIDTGNAVNRTVVVTSHGDGTHSKPRKGAFPDEPLLDEEPLKHDNTSVKPRKGVGDDPTPLFPSSTSAPSNTTVSTSNLSFTFEVVVQNDDTNASAVLTSSRTFAPNLNPVLNVTPTEKVKIATVVSTAEVRVIDEVAKSEAEWQRELSSSSLHLVIALSSGLMVLLGVMGVVAKRIYDQWQRRHYHRMDFLIDGMYHGEG